MTCLITFKAEVDKEVIVDDEDWEDLSCARTEVDSDDLLGEETRLEMEIVMVLPNQPLDPLPDGVAFLRNGERVPDGYGGAMPRPRSGAHLIPYFPRREGCE